jgi:hypothetical protein
LSAPAWSAPTHQLSRSASTRHHRERVAVLNASLGAERIAARSCNQGRDDGRQTTRSRVLAHDAAVHASTQLAAQAPARSVTPLGRLNPRNARSPGILTSWTAAGELARSENRPPQRTITGHAAGAGRHTRKRSLCTSSVSPWDRTAVSSVFSTRRRLTPRQSWSAFDCSKACLGGSRPIITNVDKKIASSEPASVSVGHGFLSRTSAPRHEQDRRGCVYKPSSELRTL